MSKDSTTTEEVVEPDETLEVEEETNEDDVVEDDGNDDDDSDDEEVVSKKDLDKVQEVNTKLRAEGKAKDAEIRKLKRELKTASEQKPEDVDSQKLVAEAESRADKFKDIAVRKEATLALKDAGAKVSTKRLIKLLDLNDVEIDNDGNVDGLADAIAELKEESPEFFASEDDEEPVVKKRVAVKRTGSIDSGEKPPVQKELTTEQKLLKGAGIKY